jgi:hypothetical protein
MNLPKKISRLEILVHPFHEINKIKNDYFEDKIPTTIHNNNYTKDNETTMKNNYLNCLKNIILNKNCFLILIPYTKMNSKGIVHDNVFELYSFLKENYYDNFAVMDLSINPNDYLFKEIKPRINNNLKISAYGEYTSGCVLNDLIRLYQTLDINFDFEKIFESLNPEFGIDIKDGYKRPWEELNSNEIKQREIMFKKIVKNNYDFYFGKTNLPIYELQ